MHVEHGQDFPSMDCLVEVPQPTATWGIFVLDVPCQLLRVVSSCESPVSGHTAENGMESFGLLLYIAAVPSLLGEWSCPPASLFPSRSSASLLSLPARATTSPRPSRWDPRTELLGQRAVNACVSGCPMAYRGLQDVEICRPDTGHLRHQ